MKRIGKTINRIGIDDVVGRELYVLHLNHSDQIDKTIHFSPSKYFVCLLCWDSSEITESAISNIAELLLKSGCVYFHLWGNACERAHDLIDRVIDPSDTSKEESVIMTTWYDDETLDDALWSFLNISWPAKLYEDECSSAIVISISSSPDIRSRIEFALRSPREFNFQVAEGDKEIHDKIDVPNR